ncbi:MAG: 50S ribosome-binding GTPase [Candidatus Methanomethylicia archaeon]|jgi:nucleolar GTP-binding protein|nr:50S ribosome-binding GTPase [Candidatus Methanomethylicia archaeon]MCQ5341288.1 50S ribosome-binding GTPase [Candidatus Methanomethylicia archaeon]
MKQPFEDIPTILNSEELIEKIIKEVYKINEEDYKKREMLRIKKAMRISTRYLENIVKSFPSIDKIHPFYREMIEIIYGISKLKSLLGRISRASRIIKEIAESSISDIKKSNDLNEMRKIRKAFLGRMASLIRKINEDLSDLSKIREKLRDLPTIDPELPTIILAGYPGVGKSTIVRTISSAKPEVRSYPFTTKEIIVGHFYSKGRKIQIIDTPGLLDRPIKSKEEQMAISALNYLNGKIAFIVDVAESNGFTLEEQKSLYDNLKKLLKSEIFVFFNKVDIADKEKISKAELYFGPCIKMIATKGIGLNEFINLLS